MRILYLVPFGQFQNKMSRVRFHQIQAIGNLVDMKYSGIGWSNYNSKLSVEKNVRNIYFGELPDLIIVFDPYGLISLDKIKVPKCIIMNEMHDPDGNRGNALKLMSCVEFDFIICHHKNEMDDPYFKSFYNKFHHIPHSANESIFRDYGYKKTTDLLLIGNIRYEKYKFRRKMVPIIEKLRLSGVNAKIHPHPGGFHDDSHTDKYLIEFAKEINKSKLCLTCSSIYKCAFGKYAEVPMCRTLLAADIPDERQEFFRSYIYELKPSDSDDTIISKLKSILLNEGRINEMADFGYKINKNEYNMTKYAERFLAIASRVIRAYK